MRKHGIAAKLSLYFTAALLAFATIMGVIFIMLLSSHTVSLRKQELTERAQTIAATLSGYMNGNHGMGRGMMGYGMYMQFIGDIAGTDVWAVDLDLNLITSGNGHGMMGNNAYTYADLPENADNLIREVLAGQTVLSKELSGLFAESTLTVGAPIIDDAGVVVGAVLLHAPVNGADKAVFTGIKLLAISLGIALVLALMLSLWLSKTFTDPIISKEAMDALRLERSRREYVANVSHELKTPVTVIRGSLEALVDRVVTEPVQVEEYQRQMLCEAMQLGRLVGDLLDLSRLQDANFAIEKHDIYFFDILDDVIRSATQAANNKQLHINLVKSGSGRVIQGDYGRIRQMLMIIMDNAIKFSAQNGIIQVSCGDNAVSIRDYGIGIPQDELPHIFERFYKSRTEDNKQGSGLGLAIAKQIAERHGIGLTVRSGDGEGTEFIVTLP